MGDRIGYRIRSGDETSAIMRKQWQDQSIEEITVGVAKTLILSNVLGTDVIGSGLCALRGDLDVGRLAAALYHVVYEPPFDSIETDPLTCDIDDNGLYEIEIVEWNHWNIRHYPINYDDTVLSLSELVAEVRFTEGKSLADGMKYVEA